MPLDVAGEALPNQRVVERLFDRHGTDRFKPEANAILELLPDRQRLVLPMRLPVVLGRGTEAGDAGVMLDLTHFNARRLGVSRRHCVLQRRAAFLVVIDLNSANGTFLNNKRLLPYQHHIVAHGDQLILGALHIKLRFSTEESRS